MKCALCSTALPSGDSPWGVYFDACHEGNMWGGDTFQTRAYLCADCGERLQAQGGVEVEETAADDPLRNMTNEEYRARYAAYCKGRFPRADITQETVDAIEAYLDRQVH